MSSSPLRRILHVSLLLAGLTLLPAVTEARIVSPGLTDSAGVARLEHQGFFERLWSALSHLWAADGPRIDPNGSPGGH
jgi:hypothetical protein